MLVQEVSVRLCKYLSLFLSDRFTIGIYVLYINVLEGPDREQHDTTVADSEIEVEGEGGMNAIRWGLERHV